MAYSTAYTSVVQPIERELWVTNYGAAGDGATDDTRTIQTCLSQASSGSTVRFPSGIFIVSQSLTYPGNIKIIGAGDSNGGTVLRVKSGSTMKGPILCSQEWYSNGTTCGYPVEISDLKIDGNGATQGAGAHGIVMMNYWSSIDRCTIANVAGDGFLLTAHTQNGTHITNTCVEAKIRRLQIRSTGGDGIHIKDNGLPLNSCTDGFLQDCIVATAGLNGINVEMAPGWTIHGNHVYGTGTNAFTVNKCYATRVIANYVDGFGGGLSPYVAGIAMNVLDGRGSSCISNQIGFEGANLPGTYQGITITGSGSATAVCMVIGNTVNGSNQNGSLGYVIQTNTTQQGHPWIVYFEQNDAQGVFSYSYIDSHVQGGNITALNHIVGVGSPPAAAAGANAGRLPPSPALTHCTDIDGRITFGTGTQPTAGAMVAVTFYKPFAQPPSVILTAINSASASLNFYVTTTAAGFSVSCVNAPLASQSNTHYGFNYHVLS